MTIQEAHNIINIAIRKDVESYLRPEDIDIVLNRSQLEEFSDLFGVAAEYQLGRPVARRGVGLTQRINDDLNPFIATLSVTSSSSGIISLPANYLYLLSLSLADSGTVIPIYEYDKFANAKKSSIITPTEDEPIARWNGEANNVQTIQLAPEIEVDITGVYLRKPATPNYAYTIDESTNTITHDSGTSTDLEWPDIAAQRIINRAIAHLALHLQDEYALRFAENQNAKGL